MDFIELTLADGGKIHIACGTICSIRATKGDGWNGAKDDEISIITTIAANNNVHYVRETPSEILDKLRNFYGTVRIY